MVHYVEQRKQSLAEAQKRMRNLIIPSKENTSLMTVRDAITGSLSLALSDEHNVSKLRIDMN